MRTALHPDIQDLLKRIQNNTAIGLNFPRIRSLLSQKFEGHTDTVQAIAVLPNRRFVTASADKTLRIWNTNPLSCEKVLEGHTDRVWSVVVHPDGKRIISGGNDYTIRIWDSQTGKCTKTIENCFAGYMSAVMSLAFLKNGHLAAGDGVGTLSILDVDSGAVMHRYTKGSGQIYSLLTIDLPSGEILVSGTRDHAIHLWNTATHACIKTLEGHTESVNALAYLPDRKLLASAASDQTVRLWNISDISTATCVETIDSQDKYNKALLVTPQQELLITGWGGRVRVRNLDTRTTSIVTQTPSVHYGFSSEYANAMTFLSTGELIVAAGKFIYLPPTKLSSALFHAFQNALSHNTSVISIYNAAGFVDQEQFAALNAIVQRNHTARKEWTDRQEITRAHYQLSLTKGDPIFPSSQIDVASIPELYRCPLSGKIMSDPVTADDNKTYERESLQSVTTPKILSENNFARQMIGTFLIEHPDYRHSDHLFLPTQDVLALRDAIRDKKLDDVKKIVEKNKRVLAYYLAPGRTVLHAALEVGLLDIFKYLLTQFSTSEIDALRACAAPADFYPIVLHDSLEDFVNNPNEENTADIRLALQWGLNINDRNARQQTALCLAAKKGDITAVEFLLKNGADMSARDILTYCALDYAIQGQHEAVICALLERGLPEHASLDQDDPRLAQYMTVSLAYRPRKSAAASSVVTQTMDTEATQTPESHATQTTESRATQTQGSQAGSPLFFNSPTSSNSSDTWDRVAPEWNATNGARR